MKSTIAELIQTLEFIKKFEDRGMSDYFDGVIRSPTVEDDYGEEINEIITILEGML